MTDPLCQENPINTAAMPGSEYSIDEEEDEGSYDLFEPGNPWSQKISTQIQRRNWRKIVYLESDEATAEDQMISQAPQLPSNTSIDSQCERPIPATNGTVTTIIIDDDDDEAKDDDDDYLFEASTPRRTSKDIQSDRGRTRDISKPWWSNGRTAPLLQDFDGSRRSFYMAQAGVSNSSTPATPAQQRLQQSTQNTNLTPSATAMSISTTPNSALRPTALPIRKALSLAGNANSSTPGSLSSIAMTPRKKTWNATWGEKASQQGNESQIPGTNKKTRLDKEGGRAGVAQRGARGNGRGKRGRTLGATARTR